MVKPLVTMIPLLFSGAGDTAGQARQPGSPSATDEPPCTSCHVCENPTEKYLCLRPCPGKSSAAIDRAMSLKRGPDLVYLDELENLYLPVPFDHKGHAEMTKMTDGCAVCHHYTPEGLAHPECKYCHEVSPAQDDMRKPHLKAAYHRQCMGCHREWSHETACGVCHPPKARGGDRSAGNRRPTKADIVGSMHPPIPEPDTEIYEPSSKPVPGAKIIFRHKEHIHRFGLKCVDCHREDNCLRCHEKVEEGQQRAKSHVEHHRPCSKCHDADNKDACDRCHWKEGEPKPKPFDHADTGWPLSRHHAEISCRACHSQVPFVKQSTECDTCHSAWQPGTFDHAVAGLVLDENHAELACADCHRQRDFAATPTCDECHDADEGVSFPARRPGRVTASRIRAGDQGHIAAPPD